MQYNQEESLLLDSCSIMSMSSELLSVLIFIFWWAGPGLAFEDRRWAWALKWQETERTDLKYVTGTMRLAGCNCAEIWLGAQSTLCCITFPPTWWETIKLNQQQWWGGEHYGLCSLVNCSFVMFSHTHSLYQSLSLSLSFFPTGPHWVVSVTHLGKVIHKGHTHRSYTQVIHTEVVFTYTVGVHAYKHWVGGSDRKSVKILHSSFFNMLLQMWTARSGA